MSRSIFAHLKAAGAAVLAAALLTAPLQTGVAQAREEDPTTAAQTDQMLRPHFDFLEHRRHSQGGPPLPKRPTYQDTVLVNCTDGQTVYGALFHVKEGGTVIVRGTCIEPQPIVLDFPVKIVGEGQSPFDGVAGSEARIQTPAGEPCVLVRTDSGARTDVRVTLQEVTFICTQAGRQSGIQMEDNADLTLVRVKMDYAGQKSAIDASTGQLKIADSSINAMSYDPALVTDGTRVSILRTILRTGSTGLVVTPGEGGLVDLDYVSIWSNSSVNDLTNEAETGIVVRGAGTFFKGDQNTVSNGQRPPNFILQHSDIFGYKVGVDIQRGIVGAEVDTTRVRHALVGVVSRADNLTVKDSAIAAQRTAVKVDHGHAWLMRNFLGFPERPGMPYEFSGPVGTPDHPAAAEIVAKYNWVYPKDGDCRVWPELHPWCGTFPDIVMAGDPTAGPAKAGWDGVPFTLPPGYIGPPITPGGDRKGFSLFGLSIGARAGGSVEPDVHH